MSYSPTSSPANPTSMQPSPIERARTYLKRRWQRMVFPGDVTALIIALGLLWMPAFALVTASWSDGLGVLFPIVVAAIITSFWLARSRLSELGALLYSTIYGFITILAVNLVALPGPLSLTARLEELIRRIDRWATEVSTGGVGTDNLIFVLFLSVLFWYLAHNTIWHVFRLDRVWRAVIPPGLVLVINNLNYEGESNLDFFLIGFLMFALLMIINSFIQSREYEWGRQGIQFSRRTRRSFLRIGSTLSVVVLLIGWITPAGSGENYWEKIEEFLGGDPLSEINELWNRLFSSLEGRGIATTDYYGGDRLDLTGSVQLSDEEVMEIELEDNPGGLRFYWRSTAFDTYDGRGWEHSRSVRAFKETENMRFNTGSYAARRDITQNITIAIRASPLVYGAPQIRAVEDIAVEAELNCVQGGSGCVNDNREADVAVIRPREPLRANDRYTVVSSMSVATADQLRAAGTDYPDWVLRDYLQGGGSVSTDTQSLAEQIIIFSGATTPYDKAKAVEQWLRENIAYDETISAPPFDKDPIDWFLFDIQRGYCNYYASAMVMMLRSQGIPARMAAGFAQGSYDAVDRTYLVRENDAHTWVEVFFPGYGWVEFEPTADEVPLERPGDVAFNQDFPTITPEPSPTMTPFPTNTPPEQQALPTATPTASPTQAPAEQLPATTLTPEFQPTATPTPTPESTAAAPAITDVEAQDDDTDLLETILLILGILLTIAVVLLLLAAFVIWWVEYRGLGGLNPIQKSYARLGIYGGWLGLRLSNRQTPIERRRVLVDAVPDGEQPINTITSLYTRDKYGKPAPEDTQGEAVERARRAWVEARWAFIFTKFRRRQR